MSRYKVENLETAGKLAGVRRRQRDTCIVHLATWHKSIGLIPDSDDCVRCEP